MGLQTRKQKYGVLTRRWVVAGIQNRSFVWYKEYWRILTLVFGRVGDATILS